MKPTAKCEECDGTGEKFILPRGNPFGMRLPQLAQALVKVRCFQCHGTGIIQQCTRDSDAKG
jgi:hypothetical protein